MCYISVIFIYIYICYVYIYIFFFIYFLFIYFLFIYLFIYLYVLYICFVFFCFFTKPCLFKILLGRKPSIWDTFVRQQGTIYDNSTGDDACKSYEFYQKDVDLLKNLGVRRFIGSKHSETN